MKVSDKGITVDCDILMRGVQGRSIDFERVFAAITVNPEVARPEVVSINTDGSSALQYALYEPATKRLLVKFTHGGMYRYDGISLQLAFDFASAESKGAFFHSKIRHRYVASKVG